KVIILSGYNEFGYVQEAMREGGVDYLLKTEGDEHILAAVRKCISVIHEERTSALFLQDAQRQLQTALPLLRNEYLQHLLKEGTSSKRWHDQFEKLQIPLAPDQQQIIVIGKVENWQEHYERSDR